MKNNQNGITLLILSITLVVLLILATVTINTGYNVLIDVRAGRIISNLDLVKIKADAIYDNFEFNGDKSLLVGAGGTKYRLSNIDELDQLEGIETGYENYNWYKWDTQTLRDLGLSEYNGLIFVNYENDKVIYSEGNAIMDQAYINSIKTKVSDIYSEYNNDETLLVGAGGYAFCLRDIENNYEMVGIIEEISNYDAIIDRDIWYKWDIKTMKSQGLDIELLKDGDIFVDYEDHEIIYTAGATADNRNYMYTLSAIKKAFEEI